MLTMLFGSPQNLKKPCDEILFFSPQVLPIQYCTVNSFIEVQNRMLAEVEKLQHACDLYSHYMSHTGHYMYRTATSCMENLNGRLS